LTKFVLILIFVTMTIQIIGPNQIKNLRLSSGERF